MPDIPEELVEELPLTPAVFQILLSLTEEERHGYSIMKEIEERTDGQLRLGPGKLYYSIQRMVERGFIEEAPEAGGAEDDDRRRYYRITPLGRRAAEAETARLETLVSLARSRGLSGADGGR